MNRVGVRDKQDRVRYSLSLTLEFNIDMTSVRDTGLILNLKVWLVLGGTAISTVNEKVIKSAQLFNTASAKLSRML